MRLHSLSTWNAITKNSSVKKYFKNFSLMTKPIKNPDALLTQQNKIKVTFNSKCKVSNNCYVLRFLLPDTNKFLGIKTCQYIYLESKLPDSNQVIRRPYHPISLDTDKGFVDILIKVYPKCDNYGVFSNYLNSLDVK